MEKCIVFLQSMRKYSIFQKIKEDKIREKEIRESK